MKLLHVVSTPSFNVARAVLDGSSYTKGTSQTLASLILQKGWLDTSFIGVRTPTEEELVIMSDSLQGEFDRLKKQADKNPQKELYKLILTPKEKEEDKTIYTVVSAALLLAEFEHVYCKGGQLIKLGKDTKAVVFGHHRTHMLLVANAARANNGLKRVEPKTLSKVYKSQIEWHKACISENTDREAAATRISTFDVLRQAHEFFQLSIEEPQYTEAYHFRLIGQRGLCQTAWRFLKLDARSPELALYKLAVSQIKEDTEDDAAIIPYRSLNKEKLQKLLIDKESKEWGAESGEVWEYVTSPLDATSKPITINACGEIAEKSKNTVASAVLRAVSKDDRKAISAFNETAHFYNPITAALMELGEDASVKAVLELALSKA